METLATTEYPSPLGTLRIAATSKGIVRIALPRAGGRGFAGWLQRALPHPERLDWLPLLDKVRRELDEYFACQRHGFDVPVDLRDLDPAELRPALPRPRAHATGPGALAQRGHGQPRR